MEGFLSLGFEYLDGQITSKLGTQNKPNISKYSVPQMQYTGEQFNGPPLTTCYTPPGMSLPAGSMNNRVLQNSLGNMQNIVHDNIELSKNANLNHMSSPVTSPTYQMAPQYIADEHVTNFAQHQEADQLCSLVRLLSQVLGPHSPQIDIPEKGALDLLGLELSSKQLFPTGFNPRETKNMGHKEKVTNWLTKVPIYLLEDSSWFNNCYPGIIDSCSDEDSVDEAFFQFTEDADVLEWQSRKLTRYVNKLYELEDETCSQNLKSSNQLPNLLVSPQGYLLERSDFCATTLPLHGFNHNSQYY